jgi:quercetin dioxygenase-like cupin family protein
MSSTSATSKVLIDNDQCRLTLWSFEVGAETGWHTHELNYVVMPQVRGKVKVQHPDGSENFSDMLPEAPYYREAPVEHNVINAGDEPLHFLDLEFKPKP